MWASCLLQISSFTVWVLSSLSQSHFHQKWSIFIQSPVYMASSEDGLLHPLNHVTKYDEDPNGMKLSSNILPYQCFAYLSAWSG
jgi:hypothetical protein